MTLDADILLVHRALKRDVDGRSAFHQLVVAHQAWLVRYLTHLLGRQSDAEDLAQEVFVRAYLALDKYHGLGSFRGWIRTIATRLAFNQRRDAATRRRYEDLAPPPAGPDPVDLGLVERQAVLMVLDDLPYAYREILVLRYVEEMSVQDIAQVLDLGGSAAKMRLSRARDRFWEVYSQKVAAPVAEAPQSHGSQP